MNKFIDISVNRFSEYIKNHIKKSTSVSRTTLTPKGLSKDTIAFLKSKYKR